MATFNAVGQSPYKAIAPAKKKVRVMARRERLGIDLSGLLLRKPTKLAPVKQPTIKPNKIEVNKEVKAKPLSLNIRYTFRVTDNKTGKSIASTAKLGTLPHLYR